MDKYIEILYKRQKKIIEEKKREEARIYCGRENIIDLIEKKLRSPKESSKPILNIYGPDSIGKSRLFKQFIESQESKFRAKYVAFIDFFLNYRLKNKPVSLLFKIINDWDPSGSLFNRFRSNSIHLKEIIEKQGEKFKNICQKEELIRKSEALTANKIISVKLLEELIRHNLDADEVDFILNYSNKQQEVFYAEVENMFYYGTMRYYENIIILDDMDSCDPSITALVKKIARRFKNKVFFLIATKEPINWDKTPNSDLSEAIEYLPLEKIKVDDMINFFLKKEIYDEEIQDMIIDISQGYPFLMEAMINAIKLNKKYNLTMSATELVEFFSSSDNMALKNEKQIAEFILKKINDIFTFHDRRLKNVIYKLGIPRYFNEEVLFLIAENDDEKITDFFVDLAGMVFTYPGLKENGDWKYHNLIRGICLDFCKNDFEKDMEIHGKLYQYFKNENPLESIYHLYQLKPLESLGKILDIFNENLQSLKIQKANDILNDFFSYFTEIADDTEAEEKGLVYTSLANMFMNLPGKNRNENIEKTVIAYDTALKIYNDKNNAKSYGATLKKLGDAYIDLFETSSDKNEENINKSLEYYRKSLQIFPSNTFPEEYAEIKRKIGLALTKFNEWKVENLNDAVDSLKESQEIYSRLNLTLDYARVEDELGSTYYKLAYQKDSNINFSNALDSYNLALSIYKKENIFIKAAETLKNIGLTHYKIMENRPLHLSLALDAFKEALAYLTREKFPQQFVEIQKYMGLSYYYQSAGDLSINIENALKYFQEAINNVDPETDPETYAQLNVYLGNTYGRLQLGDRIKNLELTLALYKEALKIYKKDKYPYEYAEIMNNYGMVYLELPTGNHRDNIKKAIELFRQALTIRTKSKYSDDYAATQMNLGSAYQELLDEKDNYATQAITAYTEALSLYNREKYSLDFAMINNNLGNIYENMAVKAFRSNAFPEFKKYICQSLSYYKNAQETINKESHPQFFEIINRNMDKIYKVTEKFNITC